jgi:hypothetical protein
MRSRARGHPESALTLSRTWSCCWVPRSSTRIRPDPPVVALVFPDGRLPSKPVALARSSGLGRAAAATSSSRSRQAEIRDIVPVESTSRSTYCRAGCGPSQHHWRLRHVLISILGVAAVSHALPRGAGVERQQLRWFVAACPRVDADHRLAPGRRARCVPPGRLACSAGAHVSVWIAVTRYRLYEIDRLISRGLSWARSAACSLWSTP